jgi:CubicO group peptidase (beta-lactamase class C family)
VEAVSTETVYDMASVTKIFATTVALMKLYDEGRFQLDKKLGDYLPWVRGSDKENLLIKDILLHQAGLVAWIPFFRETIDTSKGGLAEYEFYLEHPVKSHSVRVADKMYMRSDWIDTMYKRILASPMSATGKYIYSDNDFIFLGKIIEEITGQPLDKYVKETFYDKLNMNSSGFKPRAIVPLSRIAPTEQEVAFRQQTIRGDVHDPGAAMFGGVAGHAGLFSSAGDLALLAQMLLEGGTFNGQRFINKETIDLFTGYHSNISRRGYGFDKPEKDNATSREPYPTLSASPLTYGHTGFTGTCVWIDPKYNLTYIFLSNRVNPFGGSNNKLSTMKVRGTIHELIYEAMGVSRTKK